MSGLDSIPVRVEGVAGEGFRTDNLEPLLQQVEQALQELCERDEETVIDLSAMPFSSQDEADLRRRLGDGEVAATVTAFGPTTINETALPGVWLVEHKDAEERRLALYLEITRIPAIMITPRDDVREGLQLLAARRDDNRRDADA